MLSISQIDQKIDMEWPLTVIDHNGRKDKVYLKKGEMVVYESAKVMHGRQFYLDGDYYENLFIQRRIFACYLQSYTQQYISFSQCLMDETPSVDFGSGFSLDGDNSKLSKIISRRKEHMLRYNHAHYNFFKLFSDNAIACSSLCDFKTNKVEE